ncbi:MAG TPA: TetR/AcrR family transcriptional regulator [Bacillota bacterium]|nr:TetR/AcrR family transcriptional regulator [Bacillota bacterium]
MGKYSVGISTQKKILAVCRELFYQKGVSKTTYDEICNTASVNRGLIPYYFKSKNNIATIIYKEFIDQTETFVSELCGNDVNLCFLLLNSLLYDLMIRDKYFCNFYNEVETLFFGHAFSLELQYSALLRLVEYNQKSFSEEELRTMSCMAEGVERGLVQGIDYGFLLEDAWSIGRRDGLFVLRMIEIPNDITEKIFKRVEAIYTEYAITSDTSLGSRLVKRKDLKLS